MLERRLRGFNPRVGIILGSGLGDLVERIESPTVVPYHALPGFPPAGIKGHAGKVVAGTLAGTGVIALSGRAHVYEALPLDAYRVPVRMLRRLGVEILVLTNAAGSVRRSIGPGRLMLIIDHINLLGMNPLCGANDGSYGPRFPNMRDAYDRDLRSLMLRAAKRARIALAEGIYLACPGPSFETAAEIRAFSRLAADAVGMSTVPEVVVARAIGMRVAGVSCITNLASGVSPTPLSHAEVIETTTRVAAQFEALVEGFAAAL